MHLKNYSRGNQYLAYILIIGILGVLTSIMYIDGAYTRTLNTKRSRESKIHSESHQPYLFRQVPPAIELSDGPKNLTTPIEELQLEVAPEYFAKIIKKRNEALGKKLLEASDDDFVPSTLGFKGNTYTARLRLKGDLPDHYDTDKWSFRIHLKKNKSLFGMEKFSIQHPKTRMFIYEWIYQRAMFLEDIINLRFKFINVMLNGKKMGVYALEEHFDKLLIEQNKRREGPIIRFNEDLFWLKRDDLAMHYGTVYYSSHIDGFSRKRTLRNATLKQNYELACSLLEGFRHQQLVAAEVFDIETLARYYALSDLLGGQHNNFHNLRFYYNPITSRLEPIAFDAYARGQLIRDISYVHRKYGHDSYFDFGKRLFNDQQFAIAYFRELERMSTDKYLERLFMALKPDYEYNTRLLTKEYPNSFPDPRGAFERNQSVIRKSLNPPKGILAYLHMSDRNGVDLRLANLDAYPIEVVKVMHGSQILRQHQHVYLDGKDPVKPFDFVMARFLVPEDSEWHPPESADKLEIHYRIAGTNRVKKEKVNEWSHPVQVNIRSGTMHRDSNVEDFSFLEIDKSRQIIRIRPGSWVIDQDLVIAPGFTVVADEGLELSLHKNASIITYSPLLFLGSPELPIRILGQDQPRAVFW